MRTHKIEIEGADFRTRAIIRRHAAAALRFENLPFAARVSVTITDDEGIRGLNLAHRGIDAPTDVLSFPLLDWTDGQGPAPGDAERDGRGGRVVIGDVVISRERAAAQAEEFGHGFRRECGYLIVHSVLHLLGYDHTDEGERKALMRKHEEEIMSGAGSAEF